MSSGRAATALASYTAVVAALTYGWLEPHWDGAFPAAYVVLALLHLATGALVARWWALLLPALAFVVALPAGYPQSEFEPLPVAAVFMFLTPVELALIAVGVVFARRPDRRTRGATHHA